MVARTWIRLALIGAALAAPACALVLGAEDLPEGTGGVGGATSGTTSSHTSSGVTSGTTSSTSSSTGTMASSTSSSSSSGVMCGASADCVECEQCMVATSCSKQLSTCVKAQKGCGADLRCFAAKCPEDAGPAACTADCDGAAPPTGSNYQPLASCVCTACATLCPELCQ